MLLQKLVIPIIELLAIKFKYSKCRIYALPIQVIETCNLLPSTLQQWRSQEFHKGIQNIQECHTQGLNWWPKTIFEPSLQCAKIFPYNKEIQQFIYMWKMTGIQLHPLASTWLHCIIAMVLKYFRCILV